MVEELTLSTIKSIASAIFGSTGPLAKLPSTIFLSMNAGINQKLEKKENEEKVHKDGDISTGKVISIL